MATAYPASSNLNQVPEESASASTTTGMNTPSHVDTVLGGHEFDLPVQQPDTPLQQPRSAQLSSPTPITQLATGVVPRINSGSGRPRPLSMPPPQQTQAYPLAAVGAAAGVSTNGSSEKEQRVGDELKLAQQQHHRQSKSSRSSNRILGDYTLSKTLGAGSMGKVKLATHNVTGEKVRIFIEKRSLADGSFVWPARRQNPSKSLPLPFNQRQQQHLKHLRCSLQTSLQRRLQGDPHSARGRTLHAPAPSIHLRHARDDRTSAPLLHGV